MVGDDFLNLFQPLGSMGRRTRDYYLEILPEKIAHPAQAKNTIFPDSLQRIAKDRQLTRPGGIGGIEDEGGPGPKQPQGHAFAVVAVQELIGHPGSQNPVDPAFQDGRGLAPPVGMDNDQAVGLGDLPAVALQEFR